MLLVKLLWDHYSEIGPPMLDARSPITLRLPDGKLKGDS